MASQRSRTLVAYRSLGEVISPDVPFVWREVGTGARKTCVLLAACGAVVLQYSARGIRLLSVSEPLPDRIGLLAASATYTYAATGALVHVLLHNRKAARVLQCEASVVCMQPMGQDQLVTVDSSGDLTVWDANDASVFATLQLGDNFVTSCVTQPRTYVNKILLGAQQGSFRIVNVKRCQVLHEFAGWQSSVTCLAQSPVIDVMAIGLEDGRLQLHNIKFDETLITLRQQWGAVHVAAFRTDGPPLLVTGSRQAGHLAVWDLDKRALLAQITDAHRPPKGSIHSLYMPHGQPLMFSAGADNAIRSWRFDLNSDVGTLLVNREGPSLPPTCVRFHGDDGEMVLTANRDSTVRAFSTRKDTKQYNFGTAATMKRSEAKKRKVEFSDTILPPIVRLYANATRESEWDNVICVHERTPMVTTWSTRRKTRGQNRLLHARYGQSPRLRHTTATDALVTACGNFGVVTMDSGHVDVFNVQSSLHRASLEDPSVDDGARAHAVSVTRCAADSMNRFLLTADSDGLMKVWRITHWKLLKTVPFSSGIAQLCMHGHNNLAAVGCDDSSIYVADLQFGRIIRRFPNVGGQAHLGSGLLCVAFDAAGHFVYSSADDRTVRVWHLVTASLVDVVRFEQPAVALTLSPTGEYLATVHSGSRAVCLWANRLLFEPNTPLRPLPLTYEPPLSLLPVAVTLRDADDEPDEVGELKIDLDSAETTAQSVTEETSAAAASTSKSTAPDDSLTDSFGRLITLSGQASHRWTQLLDLNEIRAKNRAEQQAKVVKPKAAPFFLPTAATLEGFAFKQPDSSVSSRILEGGQVVVAEAQSALARQLHAADTPALRSDCWLALTCLSAGQLDFELRALSVFDSASELTPPPLTPSCRHLLLLFDEQLERCQDFELVNAYLGAFLKLHRVDLWTSTTSTCEDLRSLLDRIRQRVDGSWSRLNQDLSYDIAVLQWLRSAIA